MLILETILFWVTVTGYALTGVANILGVVLLKRKETVNQAQKFGLIFLGTHTCALLARLFYSGHFPVKGGYENALVGSLIVVALYYYVERSFPAIKLVGSGVFFVSLLVLGFNLNNIPEITPLTPPYKTIWLFIHVLFAWLAYGSYTIAAALAGTYLIKENNPSSKGLVFKMPDINAVDELWLSYVIVGLVTNGVMIISGAIWAHYLWGSFWSWDPVETWSLITWLLFALFLHLRFAFNLQKRKLAVLTVAGLITINITFWGIQFITGTFHLFKNI